MVVSKENEPRPWRPLIPAEQLPEHAGKATLVLDLNKTLMVCSYGGKVIFRPHAEEFVKRMSELYELILFTCNPEETVSPIIETLDPKGDRFAYRLYIESCTFHLEYVKVKDLSMLGRDMERVMIVDDSQYKAVLNMDNWIPISSFYGHPSDTELLDLIPFLEMISELKDVRPKVKEYQTTWSRKHPKRPKF